MEQEQKKDFLSGITGISRFSVIALIVILLFAVFVIFKNEAEAPTSAEDEEEQLFEEETEETDGETGSVHEDTLKVIDQEAGGSVLVSEMSLTESRWVVIHEDLDGEPGNILGARLFFEGDTEGEVSLLRNTSEGGKYYAILYMVAEREKDQDRRFDIVRDLPLVKEDNGDMVTVPFNTF